MRITIAGIARVEDSSYEPVTDPSVLKPLDGKDAGKQSVVEFLAGKVLAGVSLVGGRIRLKYVGSRQQLWVVSDFWAPRKLTREELDALIEETKGQWSDGIGEGMGTGGSYRLNLISSSQSEPGNFFIKQQDDGKDVPRYAHLPRAYFYLGPEIVEQAVADKADLNATYEGSTTLDMALRKQDMHSVDLLIRGGADLKVGAPLVAVCSKFEDEDQAIRIAEILIRHGAALEERWVFMRTPLQYAESRNMPRLAECLKQAGARK